MRCVPVLLFYAGLFVLCTVFNKGGAAVSEGLADFNNPCRKWDDIEIQNFWNKILLLARQRDEGGLRKMTFDSVLLCDVPFSSNYFLRNYLASIFDSTVLDRASRDSNVVYIDGSMEIDHFPFSIPKNLCVKDLTIPGRRIQVSKAYSKNTLWNVTFDFIKTEAGYRLLKCGSFGGPFCR